VNGRPRRPHRGERRLDDPSGDLAEQPLGPADRRVGPHPAGVRPQVAGEQPLVVLRRRERDGARAVGDEEERELLAAHVLLDQHLGPGRAEAVADEHVVDRLLGLRQRRGDHHPLAGCEPRGLHHHGRAERTRRRTGRRRVGVARRARRRDPRVQEELLGERLARLQPRGRPRRPEHREAARAERVDHPGGERRFRADDRERRAFGQGERDERVDVAGRDRHAPAERGDPRVAGRGDQFDVGALAAQLPRERVLAPAAADQEDFHGAKRKRGRNRPAPPPHPPSTRAASDRAGRAGPRARRAVARPGGAAAGAEGVLERRPGAAQRVADARRRLPHLLAVVAGRLRVILAQRLLRGRAAPRVLAGQDARVGARIDPPLQLGDAHRVERVVPQRRVERPEHRVPPGAPRVVLGRLHEEGVEVEASSSAEPGRVPPAILRKVM
jgi:hypothetical protein